MESKIEKTNQRVIMADALRGFALLAILFLHSIEHFGIFGSANENPEIFERMDKSLESFLFFLFSGKAYALFSLLLGFSFWVQFSRKLEEGRDIGYIYLWRLFLLLIIGLIHAMFYSGDILVLYALTGSILVLTRYWSNKSIIILAILLLCEPLGLYRVISLSFIENYEVVEIKIRNLYQMVRPVRIDGNLGELIVANLKYGLRANNAWNWEHGRVFQTPGLFLIGVLIARKELLIKKEKSFWLKQLVLSVIFVLITVFVLRLLPEYINSKKVLKHSIRIVNGYQNIFMTFGLLSMFTIIWKELKGFEWLSFLVSYGRMSLTNYILQGLIGIFVFQGVGMNLYKYTGATLATGIGLLIFLAQIKISTLWLSKYSHGPIELLWRRATWISGK